MLASKALALIFTAAACGILFIPQVHSQTDDLQGVLIGYPTICSWDDNRLDVFGRGTDNALYHQWWNGGPWSGWENLGGGENQSPSCVSWGPNRVDCFVSGMDNAMFHKWWDGTWHDWESLGGGLTSAPGCTSQAVNSIDCFVRGNDNAMWKKSWNGNAWIDWVSLGGGPSGGLSSAPACVSRSVGQVDCFALGTDGAVWTNNISINTDGSLGQGGTGWSSIGGQITGAPGAVALSRDYMEVMGVGQDNMLWRKVFSYGQWRDWVGSDIPMNVGVNAVRRGRTQIIDYVTVGQTGNTIHGTLDPLRGGRRERWREHRHRHRHRHRREEW